MIIVYIRNITVFWKHWGTVFYLFHLTRRKTPLTPVRKIISEHGFNQSRSFKYIICWLKVQLIYVVRPLETLGTQKSLVTNLLLCHQYSLAVPFDWCQVYAVRY